MLVWVRPYQVLLQAAQQRLATIRSCSESIRTAVLRAASLQIARAAGASYP